MTSSLHKLMSSSTTIKEKFIPTFNNNIYVKDIIDSRFNTSLGLNCLPLKLRNI